MARTKQLPRKKTWIGPSVPLAKIDWSKFNHSYPDDSDSDSDMPSPNYRPTLPNHYTSAAHEPVTAAPVVQERREQPSRACKFPGPYTK